jgi:hypothetical protein
MKFQRRSFCFRVEAPKEEGDMRFARREYCESLSLVGIPPMLDPQKNNVEQSGVKDGDNHISVYAHLRIIAHRGQR